MLFFSRDFYFFYYQFSLFFFFLYSFSPHLPTQFFLPNATCVLRKNPIPCSSTKRRATGETLILSSLEGRGGYSSFSSSFSFAILPLLFLFRFFLFFRESPPLLFSHKLPLGDRNSSPFRIKNFRTTPSVEEILLPY